VIRSQKTVTSPVFIGPVNAARATTPAPSKYPKNSNGFRKIEYQKRSSSGILAETQTTSTAEQEPAEKRADFKPGQKADE